MKILHTSAAMTRLAAAALATCVLLSGSAMAQQSAQPEQPPTTTSDDSRRDATSTSGDAWITAKVKAALLADTDVRGLALDVDTKDGVVTLRGTAATQAEIDAAKKIAKGIEGVRDVNVRSVAIDATR
jgi:hyperosmotically inducible protein